MTQSAHQDKPYRMHQWLKLVHCKGFGQKTLQKALHVFPNIDAILNASKSDLIHAGFSSSIAQQLTDDNLSKIIEEDLTWAEQSPNHIITLEDPLYPQQLKNSPEPPWVLYVKGDPEVLSTPQIAVVGSRNASTNGLQNAHDFSYFLAANGVSITSGLALGIDTQAHQGALDAKGLTVAVAATGLDRVYPAQNRQLAHQIIEEGAIISENPLGTQPQSGFFPRRNRIISALSVGTLVVEGAINSGSLITAKYAMEQGREVFAIPGSIHNPLAKGCHSLIKQGAKLVESAEDIFSELTALFDLSALHSIHPPKESSRRNLDEDYLKVLNSLEHDFISVDQVVEKAKIPAETVSSILLVLELEDYIIASAGGMYALNPKK